MCFRYSGDSGDELKDTAILFGYRFADGFCRIAGEIIFVPVKDLIGASRVCKPTIVVVKPPLFTHRFTDQV